MRSVASAVATLLLVAAGAAAGAEGLQAARAAAPQSTWRSPPAPQQAGVRLHLGPG